MHRPIQDKRGFTLVELLAAMAILSIIVLLLARVFADSTKVWQLGTRRIIANTDGRAVIDFIVRELSDAIVDDVLTMKIESDYLEVLGMETDRIFFVSAANRPEYQGPNDFERQAIEIGYEVRELQDKDGPTGRFGIWRGYRVNLPDKLMCYKDSNWWHNIQLGDVIAENVRTLEFWAYDSTGQSCVSYDSADARFDGGPAWIDVYIELLGEDDAIRAALLSGTAAEDFANEKVRRFHGRAYLRNRLGYMR